MFDGRVCGCGALSALGGLTRKACLFSRGEAEEVRARLWELLSVGTWLAEVKDAKGE